MRARGGVSAAMPDAAAIDAYLAAVDVPAALAAIEEAAGAIDGVGGRRGRYLAGLAISGG